MEAGQAAKAARAAKVMMAADWEVHWVRAAMPEVVKAAVSLAAELVVTKAEEAMVA
jgi:hypothetical protein